MKNQKSIFAGLILAVYLSSGMPQAFAEQNPSRNFLEGIMGHGFNDAGGAIAAICSPFLVGLSGVALAVKSKPVTEYRITGIEGNLRNNTRYWLQHKEGDEFANELVDLTDEQFIAKYGKKAMNDALAFFERKPAALKMFKIRGRVALMVTVGTIASVCGALAYHASAASISTLASKNPLSNLNESDADNAVRNMGNAQLAHSLP